MDWILDHLWVLLAAAGAIAQMLIKAKSQGKEELDEPPQKETAGDPTLADQTRRIREEIQRKIDQRRRAAAAERRAESVTETESDMGGERPPLVPQVFSTPRQTRELAGHVEAQRQAEILERQATLAEQLAQAVAMKAAMQRRTTFETSISDTDATNDRSRGALVVELRDPAALRRAFVLREILGPPVALR